MIFHHFKTIFHKIFFGNHSDWSRKMAEHFPFYQIVPSEMRDSNSCTSTVYAYAYTTFYECPLLVPTVCFFFLPRSQLCSTVAHNKLKTNEKRKVEEIHVFIFLCCCCCTFWIGIFPVCICSLAGKKHTRHRLDYYNYNFILRAQYFFFRFAVRLFFFIILAFSFSPVLQ